MEAIREVTSWGYNHTYLVQGNRVVTRLAAQDCFGSAPRTQGPRWHQMYLRLQIW